MIKSMVNIFRHMTKAQFARWERIRQKGRPNYVLKRTVLYGAIIPSLIIWVITSWTSFWMLLFWLAVLSLPIDYALARCSWVFQEYRYKNTKAAAARIVIT